VFIYSLINIKDIQVSDVNLIGGGKYCATRVGISAIDEPLFLQILVLKRDNKSEQDAGELKWL